MVSVDSMLGAMEKWGVHNEKKVFILYSGAPILVFVYIYELYKISNKGFSDSSKVFLL